MYQHIKGRRFARFGKLAAICTVAFGLTWTCSGSAEAQDVTANSQSGADTSSAAEQAKQAANPLTNIWMLQLQQNNNWLGMPQNKGSRLQSNLQFQPLLPVRLNDDWSLVTRPVMQLFNSAPYVDVSGTNRRTTGFGDTVLAIAAAPGHNLVGNWLVAAGPTFIFPTASASSLGQKNYQVGPLAALGYQGKDYITYVLVQQWFSFAGRGQDTSQMATYYAYIHCFESGWTVGTQSQFTVDWKAADGEKVTFPVGLQVGKLVHVGPLPVKIDVQASYYAVHPDVGGPKWGVQLQISPIIPSLFSGKLFD